MPRPLRAVAVAFLFVSYSGSASEIAEFFNSAVSDLWTVRGAVLKEQAIAPTCTAETKSRNGSYVHLSKDIDEKLYFLWVHNVDWNLADKEMVVRLDFYDRKGQFSFATLRAVPQKGDSLDIPIDNPKAFLERFMLSSRIQLTLPRGGSKFDASIDKPIEIVSELARCIDAWDAAKSRFSPNR